MKILRLFLLLISITSNLHASLYQCTSVTSEPHLVSGEKKEIRFSRKRSKWISDKDKSRNQTTNLKPFLFYYVIDTPEPFMQLTVKYELAKLEAECMKTNGVNFVAILNSDFISNNSIRLCKNKILSKITLDRYKDLNKTLTQKRDFLGSGNHTSELLGPMKYLVRYEEITNKAFWNYPLAHPDFLYELLNLITTNESFFPYQKYIPYISLKSHGSEDTILSGLYDCQANAKFLTQSEIIKKTLSASDYSKLETFKTSEDVRSDIKGYEELLNVFSLAFKNSINTSGSLNSEYGLNSNSSDVIFGLGTDNGLGDQLAFGLHHVTLNAILNELFNKKNKRNLGFLMLESCDSRREATFNLQFQKNVLGYYSANNSLWYRNLNWWEILSTANNDLGILEREIEIQTISIQNMQIGE